MNIKKNILETIGNIPLVMISKNIIAKIESKNPGGSVKDRIAYKMIVEALNEGKINKDTVIIEPTSGNTGVGLAMVCAALQLKCIIVMPDTMSMERRMLLQAYGAELILTEGKLGMKGAIHEANQLHEEILNSFIPQQFENSNNPLIHYETTAKEIYQDMDGDIDFFVAGIGTGGTISGVGKYLKEMNPNIQVIGVEPFESALITRGVVGSHKIQGIGAGFLPKNLNLEVIDDVYAIDSDEAFIGSKTLAKEHGILVGISSGAAYVAALKVSEQWKNKKIVVLFPDTGERYLSTTLFK